MWYVCISNFYFKFKYFSYFTYIYIVVLSEIFIHLNLRVYVR